MATTLENAASKGTANTALGIGIGALALELLRGGFGGLGGILGGPCGGPGYGPGYGPGCGGYGPGYGHGYGNAPIILNNTLAEEEGERGRRGCGCCEDNCLQKEIFYVEKQMLNNRLADYVYNAGVADKETTRICDLEKEVAVLKAIQPYQNKITKLEIEDAKDDWRWQSRYFVKGKVMLSPDQICTGTEADETAA